MDEETPKKPQLSPLEQKIVFMRNANPQVFADFVKEFANFTGAQVNTVIYAPAPDVQMAQGRAQMCQHLTQVFAQIMNAK